MWFHYYFAWQDEEKKKKYSLSRNRSSGCFPNKTDAINSSTSDQTRLQNCQTLRLFAVRKRPQSRQFNSQLLFNSMLRMTESEQICRLTKLRRALLWGWSVSFERQIGQRRQEDNGLISREREGSLISLMVFRKSPAGRHSHTRPTSKIGQSR